MPRVTVLMPSLNRAAFLGEAVSSVLSQSFTDWELVVIDDNSSDNSVEVVEAFEDKRIRVVRNTETLGVAKSLNEGVLRSDSEFIARLDSDDQMASVRLERQIQVMAEESRLGVLGTGVLFFGAGDVRWKPPSKNGEVLIRMCFENALAHPSVLIRRQAIDPLVGPYRPDWELLEDWDLWERVSRDWQLSNLPELLTRIRLHEGQYSRSSGQLQRMGESQIRQRFRDRLGVSSCALDANLRVSTFYCLVVKGRIGSRRLATKEVLLGVPHAIRSKGLARLLRFVRWFRKFTPIPRKFWAREF